MQFKQERGVHLQNSGVVCLPIFPIHLLTTLAHLLLSRTVQNTQISRCGYIPVVNQHHSSYRVKAYTGLCAQVPTCTFVDAFLHCSKQFMHNFCSSSQNFYYRYTVETTSQFSRKQFRREFYTSFISVICELTDAYFVWHHYESCELLSSSLLVKYVLSLTVSVPQPGNCDQRLFICLCCVSE